MDYGQLKLFYSHLTFPMGKQTSVITAHGHMSLLFSVKILSSKDLLDI